VDMVFLSKEGLLCNFKSANHVRFFQPDNTLNPEEPFFIPFFIHLVPQNRLA